MDLMTLQETPPWEWPGDAGKTIQATLADRRAVESDRLIAAGLAGNIVVLNDDLVGVLLSVAGQADQPEELRALSAISLGPVLELADTDGFDEPEFVPISERTFHRIQDSLRTLYFDSTTPKQVRRRILEASICAPQDWHPKEIRTAYASRDREWILTAVFAMRWIRGFDKQILEALKSPDPEIHCEAVEAAGNWGVDAAWPHVAALLVRRNVDKSLLLAAIGAAGNIRPSEAPEVLANLADSEDEEIAEAAREAIAMADLVSDVDDEEDEEEDTRW